MKENALETRQKKNVQQQCTRQNISNPTYTEEVKHPADRDKQLQKLENLTQKANQSVRMFIEKIYNIFNSIYDDTHNQNLAIKKENEFGRITNLPS